ncbi:MAG: phosphoribosyltransferase family protein, partial [Cyclobacteriaceae bacterium]
MEMEKMALVLNHRQIQQKITRIAYEVYERNVKEEDLIFAGLTGMGYQLAELVVEKLRSIAPFQVQLIKVILEKSKPKIGEISLSESPQLKDKSVILVDDVLFTGRTVKAA